MGAIKHMKTYQDLLEYQTTHGDIRTFVRNAIQDHKASIEYKNAFDAQRYYEKRNTTICAYQKLLYTLSGQAVPDNFSANYKLCSGFYETFTTQEIEYLLGNGITLSEADNKKLLGKDIDSDVQDWATKARIGGVAFGFWNLDHLEIFTITEFVPLYDEEDGSLKAGIRFWQIAADKPLRATLYELDGYTDFMWTKKDISGKVLKPKRFYKVKVSSTIADGDTIFDGENYPTFPIVPMYSNKAHTSSINGLKEQIDCYDLIKSGFANDVDDASLIYWTINNAGGMDDIDLVKFIEHMKIVKAAVVEDGGAHAESHTIEAPYASREAILNRLETDLYRDAMALDVKSIASGAATATQIKAAYEPLNEKGDLIEYQILTALNAVLELAGIDDDISFSRSIIINKNEEIQVVLQAAEYLPNDYITEKILTILGDADRLDEILEMMQEDETDMFGMEEEEGLEEPLEEPLEEGEEGEEGETDDGTDELIARLEKLLGGI